ncbi:MAG: hypothetical protein N5P05_000225 [Chroococcopsis gigantea SAG 12.99]|jgi:DNA phosphorothioation system restriction enzyme|nr:DNA phosphorothioation system restriction enzyme [Chlorogloea purpurea SAG 13.99]MDV2998619.1 hypothetical protein [Chroococcopsis gigantea SAG 12.99]
MIDEDYLLIDWQQLAKDYQASWQVKKVREAGAYYGSSPDGTPKLPHSLKLRDYQKTAILGWFHNRGRGTLKMATGSGKTITALALATELYEKIGLEILVIICPYRHLVSQWAKECSNFNLLPILAFESVYNWQSLLSNALYNLRSQQQKFVTIITTNSSFIGEGFQSQLKFFTHKTLIIGDEAHNLGSSKLEELLPRHIGLRLGLSATPERYFDDEGTEAVIGYFGEILQPEFTLADAIEKGALVNYHYYPIFVELTGAESLEYAKITQKIGWAMAKYDRLIQDDNLTSLLMQRARLVGAAQNKIPALRRLMLDRLHTTHTLFYCGDGQTEDKDNKTRRQLETVSHLLGVELGYRVSTYSAETPLNEREKIRQQFDRGELQGLVAIRCLDEGIDIPSIQTAVILASSSNPRQFIQRRGRILRPYGGKNSATLFDMIVMPPELDRETWQVEKNLLRKELKRFVEFARLARNADEAIEQLKTIENCFGVED